MEIMVVKCSFQCLIIILNMRTVENVALPQSIVSGFRILHESGCLALKPVHHAYKGNDHLDQIDDYYAYRCTMHFSSPIQ